MGLISKLKLAVPWGHIAARAWGSHQAAPVLCLHGWLDNANSFDRLIPLLPKDFYYVAMDFGGHGLSSHYSPGFPYYHQNFVSEVRRVAAALKWNRFSILGHSFGGTVGGTEIDNLLTCKRRAIEHVLQVEASRKPAQAVSPEEMLQGFLKNNSHVGEACGKHLLQRGTTQVATVSLQQVMTFLLAFWCFLVHKDPSEHFGVPRDEIVMPGVWLNRDRRITWPEHCFDFVSRELFVHYIKNLQAQVLLIKATEGYYAIRRENDGNREPMMFVSSSLKSVLKERFQYVEVPGNHYIHMNQPQQVAGVISSFLQNKEGTPAPL
ncbi:PREDICTED: serine hydrolase-like protein 2 isoform X2 [Capra hircus]|uniref:serine hydrolase-like protein 2 isoform X2 n=1 Tax=Capra hircus TaxID=9925 RepID=UPI0006B13109|nr:PREDICTED: serine hydrolase-like protein 2 isoform X2 [Capra hircus]